MGLVTTVGEEVVMVVMEVAVEVFEIVRIRQRLSTISWKGSGPGVHGLKERMMDGCTHLAGDTVSILAGRDRRLEEGEDAGEENRRDDTGASSTCTRFSKGRNTPSRCRRTSGDESRLRGLAHVGSVCVQNWRADGQVACPFCACVRRNAFPYQQMAVAEQPIRMIRWPDGPTCSDADSTCRIGRKKPTRTNFSR
ncbi:hypothetical protein DPX16_8408 [Anabarilius grahami]|uniref:Uncharacterized protein n=1 Tax=Anabarilius grahami TaxID=495550 RepID=A0A3N0Z2T8_ANAGA|nr:hypothetical protein DPX16_8408 [Anabarilius grahami]